MVKNLIFIVILFSIIVFIIHNSKKNKNTNKESFVDSNKKPFVDSNFILDKSKIYEEKSVRFSRNSNYNASRIIYGFNDLEYFKENKDNLFAHYNIKSDKLKAYFDDRYNDVKNKQKLSEKYYNGKSLNDEQKNILQDENNEIGIGIDFKNNVEKIYVLVDKDIYSLKKNKNNKYIESIYKDDYSIQNKDVEKYLGKQNFDIIDKNIELLRLTENTSFTQALKNMNEISKIFNTQIDINGLQNTFDRDMKKKYIEKNKHVINLPCFTRYDDNILTGYNFDIYEKKLLVEDSKPFLQKLLTELGCNINNIDKWISTNKGFILTYISFIVLNNDIYVTVYYNKH